MPVPLHPDYSRNTLPARYEAKSYGLAILMSFLLGGIGAGEWYLGNRRLAIVLLCLLPFGAPGFWVGVIRAVYLIYMGRPAFEHRYGEAATRDELLGSAQRLWSEQPYAGGAASYEANMQRSESGLLAAPQWNYQSDEREALIAGRLSLDAYLDSERRGQR